MYCDLMCKTETCWRIKVVFVCLFFVVCFHFLLFVWFCFVFKWGLISSFLSCQGETEAGAVPLVSVSRLQMWSSQ